MAVNGLLRSYHGNLRYRLILILTVVVVHKGYHLQSRKPQFLLGNGLVGVVVRVCGSFYGYIGESDLVAYLRTETLRR